ncbi:MAG: 50S ribosomal protein L11 methyltransferase [Proteobacteria bacterium]|nr:50S ribosomal protein L11 methyltransferase [Pseudomonadota bacterium]MBU1738120.1 50S ribosomal protein L11 methyltransferase [Pseudomonadota bacterium]
MPPVSIPEFDPALRELSRLHVLIRLPEAIAGAFSDRVQNVFADVALRHERESGVLLLIAGREHEAGVLLPALAEVMREFDNKPDGVAPEIVETRMAVPEELRSGRPDDFSRFVAIHGNDAGGTTKKFLLVMAGSTVFGSGSHPSTRLAVKALEHLYADRVFPARVLDVGCGSGILSFCSCLFGAREVLGIDISREAIGAAEINKSLNPFADKVVFAARQLSELAGPYNLIIANVTAAVMSGMVHDFSRLSAGGGHLVLSGLLGRQETEVAETMRDFGFRVAGLYGQDRWRALLLAAVDGRP